MSQSASIKIISKEATRQTSVDDCCATNCAPQATTEEIAINARIFAAIADPTRLGIVSMLAHSNEPVCVCEITPAFDLGQPTISHHLRVLREAHLVDCEKRGLWVYYWLNKEAFATVAAYLTHLQRTASGSFAL